MKTFHQLLVLGLILMGCSQNTTEEPPTTNKTPKFLSISDIHFNPFYDTTLVNELVATDYQKWDNVFKKSKIKDFGKYGHDSNYNLFSSSLVQLKAANPNPEFITISGDFLAHYFEGNYQNITKNKDEKALQEFIVKTMNFIAHSLEKTFPNTVIYPALGNNDSFCGDYQVKNQGKFLSDMVSIWSPFLKKTVDLKEFKNTFSKGGYYSAKSPSNKKHRFIALNTIQFSIKYQSLAIGNYCDMVPDSSANVKNAFDQLQWLEKQLEEASAQNEKVWLIYHIPPGVNAYSTVKGTGNCEEKIATYWKDPFTSKFSEIINKYENTVSANLAGHSHMDNFIIMNKNEKPSSFVHITPAISPIFGNNPGFFEYSYDLNTCTLQNYNAFFFKDLEKASKENWQKEYDFKTIYKKPNLTAKTLKEAHTEIESDSTLRQHFIDYYVVEDLAESDIDPADWKTYWCSMISVKNADFCNCMSSGSL